MISAETTRPVVGAAAVRRLGVGFPYLSALPGELYRSGLIDFVEITPEFLCHARRGEQGVELLLHPRRLGAAREACGALPTVVHGVELSIGSAHGLNEAYLAMLERLQAQWPFDWHSEHLIFQTVGLSGSRTLEIGTPLPLPPTREAAALVAGRAERIRARFGVPFLLENPAHYLAPLPSDPEIGDEFGLMKAVLERSGCGQLLDLHNLYCNAVNFGFDPVEAIERIDLDRVLEIHVAGGHVEEGFRLDAHDGRVPGAVWDLLELCLPRCPAAAGVVFEVLDLYAPLLGVALIEGELAKAREICCAAMAAKVS